MAELQDIDATGRLTPQEATERIESLTNAAKGHGAVNQFGIPWNLVTFSDPTVPAFKTRNPGGGAGIDTDRLVVSESIITPVLLVTGAFAVTTGPISFFGVVLSARAAAWTQTYTDIQRSIDDLVSNTPSSFSGISSGLGGSPYASNANLNDLRSEFGLLRADVRDVKKNLNSLLNDLRAYGLEQ